MLVNQKPTGRASTMAGGIAWGTAWAMLLTAGLGALLAFFVSREVVRQENLGYGVMVILFLGGAMAFGASYRRIKRRRLLVFVLSAVGLLGSLTALTALFFGGQFEGIFPTAMLIIGGSGTAFLLSARKGTGEKHRKMGKHFR